MTKYPGVEYQDYLKIETLTNLQNLKSEEFGKPAHDEMLFIIVHQVYELWFKQILTEIDSILTLFKNHQLDDRHLGNIVARLERVVKIQDLMVRQIDVLETMTAMDFLEFRDFLYPASGFQSIQNRLIENKLGLLREKRLKLNNHRYTNLVAEKYQASLLESEDQESLFDLLEKWLERTPFLNIEEFNFWEEYRKSVHNMFESDRQVILKNDSLSEENKKRNLAENDRSLESFESLFDPAKHQQARERGEWRLSVRALHASLFIYVYRDEPALQLPYRLLNTLTIIDENFTAWRSRHAQMAYRMLGRKIGTGGSSGHDYLRAAADQHKIYSDLFNLGTFFIPRSQRPDLPDSLSSQLGFNYQNKD